MLPARTTELARTADLHILYRRAASAYAGAITPEVKAQLWAEAEKLVPPLKEKETMIDIEQARSNFEPSDLPVPLKYGDTVRIVADANEDTWQGKTGIIKRFRGNGKGGLAAAEVEIDSKRRYFSFEDLIAVPADDAKIDALVEAHEPTPAPEADAPIRTLLHHVAIERPGGEYTIGIPVVSAANAAPAGTVPVQVAPGVIETVERFEIKTLGDVLAELGKAKAELAQRNDTIRRLLDSRKELEKQLDALKSKQQIFPLGSNPTGQRVAHICPKITERELEDAWAKRWSFYDSGWTVDPESGAVNYNVVFIETKETVEPKPEDKPGNVRDFPVPDAELTTEGDGVSARASGLPVSASRGLGRGVGIRRA